MATFQEASTVQERDAEDWSEPPPPNHKGMPVLEEGKEPDYLRRQVLTSRNVRGSRLVDFALGGLNYRIEHHLFPSMPRPTLRHAQPLVRAFCAERGLAYSESSVFGAYAGGAPPPPRGRRPAPPGRDRLAARRPTALPPWCDPSHTAWPSKQVRRRSIGGLRVSPLARLVPGSRDGPAAVPGKARWVAGRPAV